MFFTDHTTPRRTDPRWSVLVKWLQAVQDNLGGAALPANDPRRTDTRRILLQKTDAAKSGVSYTG